MEKTCSEQDHYETHDSRFHDQIESTVSWYGNTVIGNAAGSGLQVAPDGEWKDNSFQYTPRNILPFLGLGKFISSVENFMVGRRTITTSKSYANGTKDESFKSKDVLLKDTLLKQGSHFKNWKERLFILRADLDTLYYYDNETNLKVLGEAHINDNTTIEMTSIMLDGKAQTALNIVCGRSFRPLLVTIVNENTEGRLRMWYEQLQRKKSEYKRQRLLENSSSRTAKSIQSGENTVSTTEARQIYNILFDDFVRNHDFFLQVPSLNIEDNWTKVVPVKFNSYLKFSQEEPDHSLNSNISRKMAALTCSEFRHHEEDEDDDDDDEDDEDEDEGLTKDDKNVVIKEEKKKKKKKKKAYYGPIPNDFENGTYPMNISLSLSNIPRLNAKLAVAVYSANQYPSKNFNSLKSSNLVNGLQNFSEDLREDEAKDSSLLNKEGEGMNLSAFQTKKDINNHVKKTCLKRITYDVPNEDPPYDFQDLKDTFWEYEGCTEYIQVDIRKEDSRKMEEQKTANPSESIKYKNGFGESRTYNSNDFIYSTNFNVLVPFRNFTEDRFLLFVVYYQETIEENFIMNEPLAASLCFGNVLRLMGKIRMNTEIIDQDDESSDDDLYSGSDDDEINSYNNHTNSRENVHQNSLAQGNRCVTLEVNLKEGFEMMKIHSLLTQNFFHFSPYSTRYFNFPTYVGAVNVAESIMIPRKGVEIPRAFLDLLIQERKLRYTAINTSMKTLKDLMIQKHNRIKTMKEQFSSNTKEAEYSLEEDSSITRDLEAYEKVDTLIKNVLNFNLEENYSPNKANCDWALEYFNDAPESLCAELLIPPDKGGACHRKSPYKKAKDWQFVPTNLNIQIMQVNNSFETCKSRNRKRTMTFCSGEALVTPSPLEDQTSVNSISSLPYSSAQTIDQSTKVVPYNIYHTVTFGATASHRAGYKKGGIDRILKEYDSELKMKERTDKLLELNALHTYDLLIEDLQKYISGGDSSIQSFQSGNLKLIKNMNYRIDTAFSQSLSLACTSLYYLIKIAVLSRRHNVILARVLQTGFLLSIESLLSTVGHEMGMIEDMASVTELLNTVSVRLLQHNDQSFTRENNDDAKVGKARLMNQHGDEIFGVCGKTIRIWRQKNRKIVVDMILEEAIASNIRKIQETYSIPPLPFDPYNPYDLNDYEVIGTVALCGVMFQQGINEQQSAVNMLPGMKNVQKEINMNSLKILQKYIEKYLKVSKMQNRTAKIPNEITSSEETEVQNLFATLDQTIQNQDKKLKKNINVLLHSSDLCRALIGTHSICCKSGKDRTSMGVTLEQARYLCYNHGALLGLQITNAFRQYGVRRENVYANTSKKFYAFNGVQRSFIPKCYQAPLGTFSGNIAT